MPTELDCAVSHMVPYRYSLYHSDMAVYGVPELLMNRLREGNHPEVQQHSYQERNNIMSTSASGLFFESNGRAPKPQYALSPLDLIGTPIT